MFDLNTIMSNKIAVRCKTEEQAKTFVERIWQCEPKACRHWERGYTQWEIYRQDTCYSLFDEGDGITLYYSPDCGYMEDGFRVVDFDDVTFETVDFGEFDNCEVDISLLFGGEGLDGCQLG